MTIPFEDVRFWLIIVALLLITSLVSGSYPALQLSSFKPVIVLKGLPKFSSSALWLRKGLVVFQFALSIILIVGTIVVRKQVTYIQTINLGYNRENLLYIPLEGDLIAKYELFKTEGQQIQGIKAISRMTNGTPTELYNGTGGIQWDGKDPNFAADFTHSEVGYDFAKALSLQFIQGRDFSKEFATDSVGYVINESALKIIGYKDPIGKPLTKWGRKGSIIGVIKDFHFTSLHQPINPLILSLDENNQWGGLVLARVEPAKTKECLAALEKICKSLNPKFPFTYDFADDAYAKLYKSEQVVSKLANGFAFLAIVISCLGLLGLVIFTAQQRTKELGIRKVLGAGPVTLFNLLSKEFLVLVLIAMVVASPLAWIAMNSWLKDYAYKIEISWWTFAVAGAVVILVALITISFRALKAAFANPVKSLRTE